MGKAYKKKTSRKKPTCGGKKKRFSRRKMKGGVAFNTSFSTSSLPSSTYIPLNPNVNDNPSWNQIDARLLPAMKGGKKTRKSRRKYKKRGGSRTFSEYFFGKKSKKEEEKRDDDYETTRDPVDDRDLKILVEAEEKAAKKKAAKTAAKEAEAAKEELQRINGNTLFDTTANYIGVEFWYNDDVNSKKLYLGKLMKGTGEKTSNWQGRKYWDFYLRFDNSGEVKNIKTHSAGEGDSPYANIFYYKKTDKGGKKARKSRRKRKMKGGSLIGTDLLTGINTTDTNSALAFGTTGGTNYMLDTITAKEVNTGEYMSPDLKPVPMV